MTANPWLVAFREVLAWLTTAKLLALAAIAGIVLGWWKLDPIQLVDAIGKVCQ